MGCNFSVASQGGSITNPSVESDTTPPNATTTPTHTAAAIITPPASGSHVAVSTDNPAAQSPQSSNNASSNTMNGSTLLEEILFHPEIVRDSPSFCAKDIPGLAAVCLILDNIKAHEDSFKVRRAVLENVELLESYPRILGYPPRLCDWSGFSFGANMQQSCYEWLAIDTQFRNLGNRAIMAFYHEYNVDMEGVNGPGKFLHLVVCLLCFLGQSENSDKVHLQENHGWWQTQMQMMTDEGVLISEFLASCATKLSSHQKLHYGLDLQFTDQTSESSRDKRIVSVSRHLPRVCIFGLQTIIHWWMEQYELASWGPIIQQTFYRFPENIEFAKTSKADRTSMLRILTLCAMFAAWRRLRSRYINSSHGLTALDSRCYEAFRTIWCRLSLLAVDVLSLTATLMHLPWSKSTDNQIEILPSGSWSTLNVRPNFEDVNLGEALARKWLQCWVWLDEPDRVSDMEISQPDVQATFMNHARKFLMEHCLTTRSLRPRVKIQQLSIPQFTELKTDVGDEARRRDTSCASALAMLSSPPTYHEKRKLARQKLSTLQSSRFGDLLLDVMREDRRRRNNGQSSKGQLDFFPRADRKFLAETSKERPVSDENCSFEELLQLACISRAHISIP